MEPYITLQYINADISKTEFVNSNQRRALSSIKWDSLSCERKYYMEKQYLELLIAWMNNWLEIKKYKLVVISNESFSITFLICRRITVSICIMVHMEEELKDKHLYITLTNQHNSPLPGRGQIPNICMKWWYSAFLL